MGAPSRRFRLPSLGAGGEESFARRARFALFVLLLVLVFAGGGGARDDILSLIYVRPAAVIAVAAMLILPGAIDLKPVRIPLLICLGFVLLMVAQLIPLPPAVWMALPDREILADAAVVAGIPQPWRPVSISPDLTLNSLAAMVVPIATLLGFAALDREQRFAVLPFLIVIAFVSALLAVAQMTGGESSALRLYRITNRDSGVGLFSNRNHQAALLVLTFPMLALWAATGPAAAKGPGTRAVIAAGAGIFLVPMILVTGSRAGLLFGGLAALAAWLLYVRHARSGITTRTALATLAIGIGATLLAGLFFVLAAPRRAESVMRLVEGSLQGDLRVERTATLTNLAFDQLPFGSGFGTFDPLYRMNEPLEALSPFYLNHAHNDLLELVITGGLPALLLMLGGLLWAAIRSWRLLRHANPDGRDAAHARLGALIVAILLAWSLIDYPLRTPSLAMLFTIGIGWLGSNRVAFEGNRTGVA